MSVVGTCAATDPIDGLTVPAVIYSSIFFVFSYEIFFFLRLFFPVHSAVCAVSVATRHDDAVVFFTRLNTYGRLPFPDGR